MASKNLSKIKFIGNTTPIEDPEGLIGLYDQQGNLIDVPAVATTKIEVLDAVSEGPIQGLVEGTYDYYGIEGETGWRKAVYTQYSDAPNLSNVKWLKSVYWDEVPVINSENQYNFQQVDMSYVTGTSNGTYNSSEQKLLGLDNPELRVSKQINKRLYGSSGDRVTSSSIDSESDYTLIHRIYNTNAKGCIVNMRVNQLYRSVNTVDDPEYPAGSVVKTRVDYKIYYKPFFSNEEKNPKSYIFGSQDYMEGKITDGILKSTRVNFFGSNLEDPDFRGWEIAIIRQTPESNTITIRNATFVDSITEIYNEVYLYPNTAIVRSKYSAEFFSNIPQRSFHVKGLKVKVPSNYNTTLRTYGQARGGLIGGANFDSEIGGGETATNGGSASVNGTTTIWDGTFKTEKEYTNNPAWVFYDLISNPIYGLGQHLTADNIDKFTLYEIAQYCDELVMSEYGELEPRFECNLVLTTREDALKVLQDLASIFRGLIFYKSGSIFATSDKPLIGNRKMTFNNANVKDGEFVYQSSSHKSRHSVAIVRFNDKKNFYKPSLEIVEVSDAIKRNGLREKEISAFGCTSRGQARRFGLWSILTDTFNTETVSFTTGLQGAYLQPNDVVAISDKYKKLSRTTGRTIGIYGGNYLEDSYNNYDLTAVGSVTKTANNEGKIGGCIQLSSSYLELQTPYIHDPSTSSFAVSGWFKYSAGATLQTIAAKRQSNAVGWDLYINTSTKRVIFTVEDTGGDEVSVTASSFGDVNAGTWYYIVASIDKTNNKIKIQINGGDVDEADASTINNISTNNTTYFRIGNNNAGSQPYAGSIDQICVWSGRHIDANQGAEMYHNGSGQSIAQMGYNCKNLISCYDLQDGPTVVLDYKLDYLEDDTNYILNLLTPSYNYYHTVTDLTSDDTSNIQRPQTQTVNFHTDEHQIRDEKSYLFLENQLDRNNYITTGSLLYTIEKSTYTTGDTANLTNPSVDYYKILNISSKEGGTQYDITALNYSPDKFTLIDEKTAFERESNTIDVTPVPPIVGIVTSRPSNPPKKKAPPLIIVENITTTSTPIPPPIDPPIEDTGDFVDPFYTPSG